MFNDYYVDLRPEEEKQELDVSVPSEAREEKKESYIKVHSNKVHPKVA
jgi:hypothetical protein